MKRRPITQQTIVFTIFVLMFAGFGLFLPGFLTAGNLLGLLQNVAILGILGLAMAIIVIGRGIDISMVAVLAVPAGLVRSWCRTGTRCRSRSSPRSPWRSPSVSSTAG